MYTAPCVPSNRSEILPHNFYDTKSKSIFTRVIKALTQLMDGKNSYEDKPQKEFSDTAKDLKVLTGRM